MHNPVGLKELRENIDVYIKKIQAGETFTIYRRSTPLFKITPMEDEAWEEVIDFTKLRRGGIDIENLLNRL